MLIIDTNVLSELMRANPDAGVLSWFNARDVGDFWLTSITLFEARMGINLLPPGKRRDALHHNFEQTLIQDFKSRVCTFDTAAAQAAARIAADRQQQGQMIDMRDTYIAGIAISKKAGIITRNLRHFADLPVPVLNPWETP